MYTPVTGFFMDKLLGRYHINIALPLVLLFHLFLLIITKFTAWPEMLNWPHLMLAGYLPYRDIAIAHNPLMLIVLTLFFKFTGLGLWELQVFTWGVILLTDLLVYLVAEKVYSPKSAFIPLTLYVLLQVVYEGNGLWFDLFMVPIALLTYYFLRLRKPLLVGIFWALAFLTKQTALFFVLPIVVAFFLDKPNAKELKRFALGVVATSVVFVFVLTTFGLLTDYFHWAVDFALFRLPIAQGQLHLPSFLQLVFYVLPFLHLLLIGKNKELLIISLFSVAGILSAFSRFELFHFQPGLPFLAIASYGLLSNLPKKFKSLLTIFSLIIVLLVVKFATTNLGGDKVRFLDMRTQELARYISDKTEPGEEIYILNLWENLYALTNTLPATKPVVPHLAWYMERSGVQEEIVSDLESTKPTFIFVGQFIGGELAVYKPQKIYTYITSHYQVINIVNNMVVYKRS